MGGVAAVSPDQGVMSSLAFAAAVLERRNHLVWFPEGERSRNGRLQEFKSGIGMLVDHFDVPVVPVWIAGLHSALPPGSRLPRFGQITVTFGCPLQGFDLIDDDVQTDRPEKIARALHDRVAEVGSRRGEQPIPV